jgi:hypothetical protein
MAELYWKMQGGSLVAAFHFEALYHDPQAKIVVAHLFTLHLFTIKAFESAK